MTDVYEGVTEVERYTPPAILDMARSVHGPFDLDVASDATANLNVGAKAFYTAEDEPLERVWTGHWWCNPPYARSGIQWRFVRRAVSKHTTGAGWVLVKAATEAGGFEPMYYADALCFISGRVKFARPKAQVIDDLEASFLELQAEITGTSVFDLYNPDREKLKAEQRRVLQKIQDLKDDPEEITYDGPARWGSALGYFGPEPKKAMEAMSTIGNVVSLKRRRKQ